MGKTPRYFNRRRQAGGERETATRVGVGFGFCPMGLKESFFFPLTPAKGQQSTKGGNMKKQNLHSEPPPAMISLCHRPGIGSRKVPKNEGDAHSDFPGER